MKGGYEIKAVVYWSTCASRMDSCDLEDLLIEAGERNLEKQISSVLIFNGSKFYHYLEGPMEAVNEIFDLILDSQLHFDVQIIAEMPLVERLFSDHPFKLYLTKDEQMDSLIKADWFKTLDGQMISNLDESVGLIKMRQVCIAENMDAHL